jgi:hypothetical protein
MWERLRRYRSLERPARGIFLRAVVLLPLISFCLRLRGFRKTQSFLQRFLPTTNNVSSVSAIVPLELTVRMVRAAARHSVGHPTCLEESLALWFLLRRHGIEAELRVGVRKDGERFEAHAWVEREGVAFNEPEALHEHYAAFDKALSSIPPETR